jgi:hypothetical protein
LWFNTNDAASALSPSAATYSYVRLCLNFFTLNR